MIILQVPEFDADYYRDRPSEEILEDQSLLERLRMESTLGHHARWEWDRDRYEFIVSKEWQELTGYDPKDWFPQDLSRAVLIEQLLENLIDNWMHMVVEEDRSNLKRAAEKFLLFNNTDNYFIAGYRIICADNTIKNVSTEARSMWRKIGGVSYLMRLVVKTQDIGKLVRPIDQAIAITRNKAEIDHQGKELDDSQAHIKEIEKQAAETKAKLNAAIGMLPLIGAFLIGGNELLAKGFKSVKTEWSLRSNPPEILKSPLLENSDPDIAAIDRDAVLAIQDLLASKTPVGDRIKLGSYDTGPTPSRYQIWRVAQQMSTPDSDAGTAPRSTSSSRFESLRTQSHLADQPSTYSESNYYQYSVPLKIFLADGHEKVFFVAIDATDVDDKEEAEIKATARELAGKIKEIIQESLAPGLGH